MWSKTGQQIRKGAKFFWPIRLSTPARRFPFLPVISRVIPLSTAKKVLYLHRTAVCREKCPISAAYLQPTLMTAAKSPFPLRAGGCDKIYYRQLVKIWPTHSGMEEHSRVRWANQLLTTLCKLRRAALFYLQIAICEISIVQYDLCFAPFELKKVTCEM